MTENEAIKRVEEFGLHHAIGDLPNSALTVKAFEMAIEALKEIQQYRAIGMVEECKEARERQRAKKVNNRKMLRDFNKIPYAVRGDCPNCGSVGLLSVNTDYCNACGQHLSWERDDE